MAGASGTKAVGFLHGNFAWTDGAVNVSPADQTVLADTGALNAGNYLFAVVFTATANNAADVQHRDSANATTLNSTTRRCLANASDDFIFPNKIALAANERIRVIENGTFAGTTQATIFWLEVA